MCAVTWMNFETIMLSKINNKPVTKNHIYYFIYTNVQNEEIYRHRKYLSSCLGQGVEWNNSWGEG